MTILFTRSSISTILTLESLIGSKNNFLTLNHAVNLFVSVGIRQRIESLLFTFMVVIIFIAFCRLHESTI